MKVSFDDSKYRWAYGKSPRGRGTWAFKIGSEEYFAGCCKTFAEAKKEVKEHISNSPEFIGITHMTVDVLP